MAGIPRKAGWKVTVPHALLRRAGRPKSRMTRPSRRERSRASRRPCAQPSDHAVDGLVVLMYRLTAAAGARETTAERAPPGPVRRRGTRSSDAARRPSLDRGPKFAPDTPTPASAPAEGEC